MILCSYNIRGIGGRVKKNIIRQLIREENVEFLAIQETKLEVVTEALCYSIWGSEDCSWAFYPSVGNSGGILSIWRKSNFSLVFSFMGDGYVGVCLEWGISKTVCFVLNVYSKCDILSKQILWNNILEIKNELGNGNWSVIGDFNAVLMPEERRGVNVESSSNLEMNGFRGFIDDLNLIDLPLLGRRFSWFHSNGVAMSRIDRCLVSPEWLECWGDGSVWVGSRDISDHCPLILKNLVFDWGPKPFRFNNHWLEDKNFKKVVESWRGQQVNG
jgi:hypothetical protein